MSGATDTTWREFYPEGAIRYYEGDDPEGFRAEIEAEFGFDVNDAPPRDWLNEEPHLAGLNWGMSDPDGSFRFFCPPEHLDAIYGSERWPLGS